MNAAIRRSVPFILLLLLTIWAFGDVGAPNTFYSGWPPNTDSEPARIQIDELAIRPGEKCKGRSLMLLETAVKERIQWGPYFFPILYFKYRVECGYEFMDDAQASGVPLANEYGHWMSPPNLALFTAAFYNPDDRLDRAAQAPRVYRANLARLMGVAMVVSDGAVPGETRLFEGKAKDHPLYIYRVANPNLGQFSPTTTVVARDASAILDQLQAPDFDGAKLAVVEAPITSPLVSSTNVSVQMNKGPSLRVTGHSDGVSLLVLPFDYSYCLRARGKSLESMVPVNLAQVGLLIRGDADIEISYRFGLFAGVSCRKHDLERAKSLGLENAATGRLFHDSRPKRN